MDVFDDEKDLLMDHEYDGIKELDNHMPVWWIWLFYFTIGIAVVYLIYYPITGTGLNMHEEYQAEIEKANEKYNLNQPESESGVAAVAMDWKYSDDPSKIAEGKEIFMSTGNLCFTCHGTSGEGLVGPNLADDLWIHGCTAEEMAASITLGFPDKGMMPFGSGAKISDDKLSSLISFIASLQGTNPANPKPADTERASKCTID